MSIAEKGLSRNGEDKNCMRVAARAVFILRAAEPAVLIYSGLESASSFFSLARLASVCS